jgi:hypothetical protein
MVGAGVALGALWRGGGREDAVSARDLDVAVVNARLDEAARSGEKLEVILVLRGRVRSVAGGSRWRIRLEGGRVLTFRADAVVAATPVGPSARRRT